MFIQTEATPNPATLKFIPGRIVLDSGTMEFANREAAARSPLAEKLFGTEDLRRLAENHAPSCSDEQIGSDTECRVRGDRGRSVASAAEAWCRSPGPRRDDRDRTGLCPGIAEPLDVGQDGVERARDVGQVEGLDQ